MLLFIKNIWSSVSPVCKSMLQVHKIMEKHWEFVWKLFCRLGILPVGGFLTLHCDTERFFLQPTQQAGLYYFWRTYRMWFLMHLFCCHDLFTFQKFCACIDDTFLVPNKFHDNHWKDSEKWWSEVLHKERFICILISRLISIIFLSTFVLNILSLCQLFCNFENFMSIFRCISCSYWENEQDVAFRKIKEVLLSKRCLLYYNVNKPVRMNVDPSRSEIGAVLIQDGKPNAYASELLTHTRC